MADDQTPTITPTAIPPGPRRSTYNSTRLLHEWAQSQPWESMPTYELRLGPTVGSTNGLVLSPDLEAMVRTRNWYADLVGPLPGSLAVVEAKMMIDFASLGQLEGYVKLVPSTPSLRPWLNRPIRPIIVCAVDDATVRQVAINKGITVEVFSPAWVADYLRQKQFRRRFSTPEGGASGEQGA